LTEHMRVRFMGAGESSKEGGGESNLRKHTLVCYTGRGKLNTVLLGMGAVGAV